MTEQSSKQGTVEGNVSKELGNLKTEIQVLSKEMQGRISAAGEEAKKTWSNLQEERKRFSDRVEQAAEETKADLRQVGSDLKRRLGDLRQQLGSQSGEEHTSQAQAGQSGGSSS